MPAHLTLCCCCFFSVTQTCTLLASQFILHSQCHTQSLFFRDIDKDIKTCISMAWLICIINAVSSLFWLLSAEECAVTSW